MNRRRYARVTVRLLSLRRGRRMQQATFAGDSRWSHNALERGRRTRILASTRQRHPRPPVAARKLIGLRAAHSPTDSLASGLFASANRMPLSKEQTMPRRDAHGRMLSRRFGLLLGVCLSALTAASEARADDALDTVMLTNGGRLRGTVMKEDPQKGTSIKLVDGTVRRLLPGDVKQVRYGGGAPVSPLPVAAVAAPSPPATEPVPPTVLVPVPAQATPGVLPAIDGPYTGQYYGPYPQPPKHQGGRGVLVAGW
jgi:hypothetical protein